MLCRAYLSVSYLRCVCVCVCVHVSVIQFGKFSTFFCFIIFLLQFANWKTETNEIDIGQECDWDENPTKMSFGRARCGVAMSATTKSMHTEIFLFYEENWFCRAVENEKLHEIEIVPDRTHCVLHRAHVQTGMWMVWTYVLGSAVTQIYSLLNILPNQNHLFIRIR